MTEKWKDIQDYEGLYKISNFGRVYSSKRNIILKNCKQGTGYWVVTLTKDKIEKTLKVHRLVAIHFIKNIENKEFVNHKDFNRQNTHVNNLEWVTALENRQHAVNGGRYEFSILKGGNHPRSKYTEEQVKKIRSLRENSFTLKEISESMNIPYKTVHKIANFGVWRHI